MTKWIQADVNQMIHGVATASTFNLITSSNPNSADIDSLAVDIYTELIVPMNDVQSDGVTNVSMSITKHGAGAFSNSYLLTGGGSYAAADDTKMPPEFAFFVRLEVSESRLFTDDSEVSNRPIQKGAIFVPGCSDDYIDDEAFVMVSGQAANWTAFADALSSDITVGAITYSPIVYGGALPILLHRPTARPECYALITGASPRRITRVRSRLF